MKQVTIYTDGACSGNPGPGGWGAVLKYGAHEKELSGGAAETTNNRMELTAVIEALKDGTLDAIATDHAPHCAAEKECGYERALNGVIGLETYLHTAF